MDRNRQQTVFTHFIKPFLSRNDSSGKGRLSGSVFPCSHYLVLLTLTQCLCFLLFLRSRLYLICQWKSRLAAEEPWQLLCFRNPTGFASPQSKLLRSERLPHLLTWCPKLLTLALLFANDFFLTLYPFLFAESVLVRARSLSGGTATTELRVLQWHRPNRSSLWATWGWWCFWKSGWISHTTDSKWKGKLHFQLSERGQFRSWNLSFLVLAGISAFASLSQK